MGKTSQTVTAFITFLILAFLNYFWLTGVIPFTYSANDPIIKFILQMGLIITAILNIFLVPLLIAAGRNINVEDIVGGMLWGVVGIAFTFILVYAIIPIAELMLTPNTSGWYLFMLTIIILVFATTFVMPNYKILAEV